MNSIQNLKLNNRVIRILSHKTITIIIIIILLGLC